MGITDLREELVRLRDDIREGQTERALARAEAALRAVDGDRLLSMAEAAEWLGIRTPLIVSLLLRAEQVPTLRENGETFVTLANLERIRDSERVQRIRISDQIHDETEELGYPGPLTEEELETLEAGRPGRPPWQVARPAHDKGQQ
jgi:hypothetical protein